ncbi:MAG TPA: LysR substrate-binding domain-containing protein [Archangium sp.]|uniref:LysR family transcriptional regulator n=1 Tax=Archangium sp. TaxID=1872627 RepID=UPI002E353EC2|nr:LysR substrate-binding domain-containing protein [Archangium sp.]HEX5752001.1 LysR substrate-binding domain-containing protein [Archangium sp.]
MNDVRVFARVVELRSISGAARKLGLPKSTISRNVARLEEALGARLIQRSTRGLGLTDTGTVFHRHCLRILEDVEAAEAAVSQLQGAPRGLLRVSVPATFGHFFLGPLLAEFLQRYPELRVALEVTNRRVDLVEEGVDVTIRAGRLADSSFISRRLGEARFVLCASPAYLRRRGTPQEPLELAAHEVADVVPLEGSRTWRLSGPAGQQVDVTLTPRLGVNDPGMVYRVVLGGTGLGWVPEFLCAEDLRAGRLRPLLPGWSLPAAEMHALFPSQRDLAPKVRAFVDFLVEKLARHGAVQAPR